MKKQIAIIILAILLLASVIQDVSAQMMMQICLIP